MSVAFSDRKTKSGEGLMLEDLNKPQRAAVCTTSGPLLVLAGAGSGKTRVITYRIARLIQGGIRPERILAVTFTNKAAREMQQRTSKLLGRRRAGQKPPEISTFHSLCVRILRRQIEHLGYPKQFAIYDQGDQDSVARSALRDIRVGHEKLRPSDLLRAIGNWKSLGVRPEAAESLAKSDKEQLAALAYARYQLALRASGALDFDDLLLCTDELLTRFAEVRVAEQTRFDHVLIDEYQDTNGLQYRIVKALAERHRNLCVVGDDDQSIYGWRGAEVAHILNFANDWPGAKTIRLEDNYRSRESILDLANKLILHNSNRHQKTLRARRKGGDPPRTVRFDDENREAGAIVHEIRHLTRPEAEERVHFREIAILFRTNEQPRAFELELRRAKIPYVLVGGQSFYDRKEVRDVLGYLKVLAQPCDEVSLLRIINTPARGIGATSVQSMLKEAVSHGEPLWKLISRDVTSYEVPAVVAERVAGFRRLIEHYQERLGREPLSELLRDLLTKIDYRTDLARVYKEAGDLEARWNTVEEVVNSLALYEQRTAEPSLFGFLEETALTGREDQRDEKDRQEKSAITLMTLHSAKGLEFPHVYMVGMEEGLLPHQRSVIENRSIDEERRLCYVGVTRAMNALTMTLCKARMKWGKAQHSIPSRFLLEMRGETERAQRAAEASEQLFRKGIDTEPEAPTTTKKAPGKTKKPASKPKREPKSNLARAPSSTVASKEAKASGATSSPTLSLNDRGEQPAAEQPPSRDPTKSEKKKNATPASKASAVPAIVSSALKPKRKKR